MRLLEQAMMQAPGFRFGRAGGQRFRHGPRRGRFAKGVRRHGQVGQGARRRDTQLSWMVRKGPGLQWGGKRTPDGPIKIDDGVKVRPFDPGIRLAARRS